MLHHFRAHEASATAILPARSAPFRGAFGAVSQQVALLKWPGHRDHTRLPGVTRIRPKQPENQVRTVHVSLCQRRALVHLRRPRHGCDTRLLRTLPPAVRPARLTGIHSSVAARTASRLRIRALCSVTAPCGACVETRAQRPAPAPGAVHGAEALRACTAAGAAAGATEAADLNCEVTCEQLWESVPAVAL